MMLGIQPAEDTDFQWHMEYTKLESYRPAPYHRNNSGNFWILVIIESKWAKQAPVKVKFSTDT